VTQLEGDLHERLGRNAEIVTHIEPVGSSLPATPARRTESNDRLREVVLEAAAIRFGSQAAHDLRIIVGSDGRRDVTMPLSSAGCRVDHRGPSTV